MSNFISQVQEAELEAKKIIDNANSDAVKIINQSIEKAEGECAKKYEEKLSESQEKLSVAKVKAKSEYKIVLSEYSPKIQEIDNTYSEKKNSIVKKCLGFVLNKAV